MDDNENNNQSLMKYQGKKARKTFQERILESKKMTKNKNKRITHKYTHTVAFQQEREGKFQKANKGTKTDAAISKH